METSQKVGVKIWKSLGILRIVIVPKNGYNIYVSTGEHPEKKGIKQMKYTMRDLVERAEHFESGLDESYKIDNYTIALRSVWSYGGGRDAHLVTVYVNGEMIATRCRRELGIRKALQAISA